MEGTSEQVPAAATQAEGEISSENSKLAEGGAGAPAKEADSTADTPQSDRASFSSTKKYEAKDFDDIPPREPVQISLRSLLEAGVHFGHQTSRWNPAMRDFIHGARNGIHIINLPKTIDSWKKARECIVEVASNGGSVLFVGTKKQAEESIVEEARRCGAFYVSRRWLGGMMTNFQTIRKSIARMNKVEEILAEEEQAQKEGTGTKFTKKERLMMSRERDKLYFSLGGIREMYSPPQLLFVVDIRREDIAVKEARRLDLPVVALVDTNCSPSTVTFPIPSNDDGTRAIRLFCSAVSDAVLEGKKIYAEKREHEASVVKASFKSPRASSTAEKAGEIKKDSPAKEEPAEAAPAEVVAESPVAEEPVEAAPAEAVAESPVEEQSPAAEEPAASEESETKE